MRVTITIAIINYNYGRFLSQALESALCQRAPQTDVEVLVIDDGSTDCSEEVFANYSGYSNVRLSRSRNLGFGASLGRAVTESKGEWIMLLDADDWFAIDKLRIIRPLLTESTLYLKNENKFVDVFGRASGKIGAGGNTSTLTIKRSAALEILPVDDESGFYLLHLSGYSNSVPDPLTYHRIHSTSLASHYFAEYARREKRYANIMRKLENWAMSRPAWMSDSARIHALNTFGAMKAFAAVEASIRKKNRIGAAATAITSASYIGLNIKWIRILARALLLKPIPSREAIFLSANEYSE